MAALDDRGRVVRLALAFPSSLGKPGLDVTQYSVVCNPELATFVLRPKKQWEYNGDVEI
jgi:hypothetical protein